MTDRAPGASARAVNAGLRLATAAAQLTVGVGSRMGRRHAPPPPTGPLRVLMVAMYPRRFTGTKYRLDVWAQRLRAQGHDVHLHLTMPDHYSERLANDWSVRGRSEFHLRMIWSRLATVAHAGRFHVAVIHINDLPHWDLGPPFVAQALHRKCGRVLLDLDDLPLVSGQRELGPKARALGQVVDGLIVGNPRLSGYYPAKPWWPVPTCVEPSEWTVPDRGGRNGPPLLGWVGTPGNLHNLEPLAPVLADVCRRHGTRVRIVCSRPAHLPDVPQEFVRWTAAGEQSDLEPIDIGLAPLIDAPAQRNKCGLKAIQYMAGGTPVVASPVGALNEIVVDGHDGLVADTNGDWDTALERLITDHDLRVRLGAAARADVEQRWSFETHAQTFDDALRGLRPDGGR